MTAEQIVRALAEADPITCAGDDTYICVLCGVERGAAVPRDDFGHQQHCPWRLAVEWVAAQDEGSAPARLPRVSPKVDLATPRRAFPLKTGDVFKAQCPSCPATVLRVVAGDGFLHGAPSYTVVCLDEGHRHEAQDVVRDDETGMLTFQSRGRWKITRE